jgi:hypothetical protein
MWKGRLSMCWVSIGELENTTWYQVGGCGITVLEEYASMKVGHGTDSTGLGRYCWVLLQGRQDTKVRLVTAYRPVENKRDAGSVWNQHVRYFRKEYGLCDVNPREQVMDDLLEEVSGWVAENETVIVGMDVNQNIRDPNLRARFHQAGLVEAISRHHSPDTPLPLIIGTNRIVQLMVFGVQLLLCGYGAFDAGADHRVLWMDIP